ncbi:MAG: hypothetical protein KGD57_09845, partial [Candidatus Lokiarchaeota archaeon]|nr:hypothetical protein [Candidatus Lokiarchaeota archaeon]
MFRKKLKTTLLISTILLIASLGMINPLMDSSSTLVPKTSPPDMTYYDRFIDLFDDIQTQG